MNTRSHITSLLWRVGLALALPATVAFSAALDGNDLARNSPFLPENYQPPQQNRPAPPQRPTPPPGPQPLDQIEFRGLTRFGGETSFSLFDPNQKRSFWIALGQSDSGFEVVEFKEREEAVVVRHDGRSRTIPLHQSKIAALAPEATPPPAQPSGRGQGRQPAAQPQDPEERMRNLAEEIRRRREIRRALVEEAEATQQPNN